MKISNSNWIALLALCCATTTATTIQAALFDVETKITALNAAANNEFGFSVAISGNTAIVGAQGNRSAYLFDATSGNQIAQLTASDAAASNFNSFGWSVGISGNTAIVGAFRDANGDKLSGSAYLFDATTGDQLAKITSSDAAPGDWFGHSVAISGDTAIVGAYSDDDGGGDSGSAYLFDVSTGNQLAKLTASDAAASDHFGYSVAISGNTAIVGADGDRDEGSFSGSAYLFDVTTGNQLAKLTASDAAPGDHFGYSVAISGNTAIVGAYLNDDGALFSGSAYLFDVTTGDQLAKLTASDAAIADVFGVSVAISGDTAIVGANGNSDGGLRSGSAYLFDVTTGNQLAKLTASDAAARDKFGVSVAISGNKAIVGANFDSDGGSGSGSAYLFENIIPEPNTLLLSVFSCLGVLLRRNR